MEFLAMLYTVLLVAICLMMALLLFRSGRPTGGLDEADCEELKDWLEEQLAAQAKASSFSLPFTMVDLADYLSIDRSAMTRELKRMKEEGLIEFYKNQFVLYHVT